MKILAIAGMIDAKLESKILPLQNLDMVHEILLVRRKKYSGNKIRCYSSPFSNKICGEIYKFISIFFLCLLKRPYVIIAFGTFPNGIYGRIASKVFRISCIQLVQGKNDMGTSIKQRYFARSFLMWVIKSGDFIGVRGEKTKEFLVTKGILREKIFIAHNVFNFSLFSPANYGKKKYDIVYTGILEPYKRVDILLNVLALLKQSNREFTLAIAGDGTSRQALENMVTNLGLDENVHFLGTLSQQEIRRILNLSRVFVMTSQGEGLPMAMLEAMACGLPLVVPDDADIPTIITNGENGFLAELGNIEDFANKIMEVMQDTDRYLHLSRRALETMRCKEEVYSVENVRNTWQAVLSQIYKD